MENPLAPIVKEWLKKIRTATDFKYDKFQKDADEAMSFFNGPYDFLYGIKYRTESPGFTYQGDEEMPKPAFAMTVNKVAEMVQLFGPVLYHRNPIRQVNPRRFPAIPMELFGDPQNPDVQAAFMPVLQQIQQQRGIDKARAVLLESYLNYTPTALDLKTESRQAIDEALIKGMGVLWTEIYIPPGTQRKMVGSFFDTIDNLMLDPDMETLSECKWCVRRKIRPTWQVEDEFGIPRGELKGNIESFNRQASTQSDIMGLYNRKRGLTNDLVEYFEIYSKMGMGGRMSGVPNETRNYFDGFGDNVYMAVADGVPYPLNLPNQVVATAQTQEIFQRLQWHTPFWADGAWPFVPLTFHQIPRELWPMSHLKPGIGELKFLNWAYSFLATKVKTACRDVLAIMKSAGEELKNKIISGKDYEVVEIERAHGTITEVVQFLQHPPFQGDIYRVIQAVEEMFEKRVGLTELMYGQSAKQMRSASEAQVKSDQLSVRPDDMANKVEDFMSAAARQEALAARWHLQPEDVQPILGQVGTNYWTQLVMTSDPNEIIHQLEYRIEAGSARKPNKERDASNMKDAMTTLFQPLWQYTMATGNVQQINALLTAWAKSIDLDAAQFLISPPAPPPPPAGGSPQPAQPH